MTDRTVSPIEVLEFTDAGAWESWLSGHHASEAMAWLRIAKRHSGLDLLRIDDARDVALCYGWIDGHRRGLDDVSFLQRYSRRRARSSWSQVNVERVESLIADGRVRAPGLAEVEAARADGRWDAAYEPQRTAETPPDLLTALAADPRALAAFEALGRSERYAVILPVLKARTPATRARAVAREVARLAAER